MDGGGIDVVDVFDWLALKEVCAGTVLDVSQPFYDGFMDQVITRLGGSEICF